MHTALRDFEPNVGIVELAVWVVEIILTRAQSFTVFYVWAMMPPYIAHRVLWNCEL
jgi:hypothetical protein